MEIISVCTLSCSEVSFFRILHYLLIWFLFSYSFTSCPSVCQWQKYVGALLPQLNAKDQTSTGTRSGGMRLNRELGWASSSTAKPGLAVQRSEVFCLVSAAGCWTLPAHDSARLDYPFYSALQTACKLFYHSFPGCVEGIVAFALLCPHLFSKLITFMLLGSFKMPCLFPSHECVF